MATSVLTPSAVSANGVPGAAEHDRIEADALAEEILDAFSALPPDAPSRPAVRDQVIRAWLPMAHRLAHRYARRGIPAEDIAQTATVGLIKAIDGYDPGRGVPFPAYAVPTILGEVKRYFRDRTWAVRVPRRVKEMRAAISDAQAELAQSSTRPPTTAEIAAHLKVSEEEVVEGLVGGNAYNAVSLSSPVGADGTMELADIVGGEDHSYELVELSLALGPAMSCLTERERKIIALRFYGNQTQIEIAAKVGVSQMHVSRLITGALLKLRAKLGPDAY